MGRFLPLTVLIFKKYCFVSGFNSSVTINSGIPDSVNQDKKERRSLPEELLIDSIKSSRVTAPPSLSLKNLATASIKGSLPINNIIIRKISALFS
ncbi:Uncharacterised protein [Legionella pneumophila]|nr:Uncharacterised protein [Legionella pneumophila]CZR16505.1 Uncharacterised protein [Legionella pneumophila]CZR23968.1 Uncharacterised protein [Legionella pneumophila]